MGLVACSDESQITLVEYSVKGCDESGTVDLSKRHRNRIRQISHSGDTSLIDLFFEETCGFVIDPKVSFSERRLLIEMDQFMNDSSRVYALCRCCYAVELKLLGLTDFKPEELSYKLQLLDRYPETIQQTDSVYHTYRIDYAVVGADTLFYPLEDDIYSIRKYLGELGADSIFYASSFPDHGDIFLTRFDPTTEEQLRASNGHYELLDSLGELQENGTLSYQSLQQGQGRRVIFENNH